MSRRWRKWRDPTLFHGSNYMVLNVTLLCSKVRSYPTITFYLFWTTSLLVVSCSLCQPHLYGTRSRSPTVCFCTSLNYGVYSSFRIENTYMCTALYLFAAVQAESSWLLPLLSSFGCALHYGEMPLQLVVSLHTRGLHAPNILEVQKLPCRGIVRWCIQRNYSRILRWSSQGYAGHDMEAHISQYFGKAVCQSLDTCCTQRSVWTTHIGRTGILRGALLCKNILAFCQR